jgi:hypothetical protein
LAPDPDPVIAVDADPDPNWDVEPEPDSLVEPQIKAEAGAPLQLDPAPSLDAVAPETPAVVFAIEPAADAQEPPPETAPQIEEAAPVETGESEESTSSEAATTQEDKETAVSAAGAEVAAGEASPPPKTEKPVRRKKARDDGQLSLFGGEPPDSKGEPSPATEPAPEDKPARKASHPPVAPKPRVALVPPLDPPVFRKAANVLSTLLAESDPGAKDCFADNRKALRPAFVPEAFVDFEKQIKAAAFHEALELLKKAARKHGVNV